MLMYMEATAWGAALGHTGQDRAPLRRSTAPCVAPVPTLSSRLDPPPACRHADQARTLSRASVLDAIRGRSGQGRERPRRRRAPCVGQERSQAAQGKQFAAFVRRARIPLPWEPALRLGAPVAASLTVVMSLALVNVVTMLLHIPPPWVHPRLPFASPAPSINSCP